MDTLTDIGLFTYCIVEAVGVTMEQALIWAASTPNCEYEALRLYTRSHAEARFFIWLFCAEKLARDESSRTFLIKRFGQDYRICKMNRITVREVDELENMYRQASNRNVCCPGVFERCGRRCPSLNPFPRRQPW